MQWRMREEDGWADRGGGWVGRPGKRTGDEGRGWAGRPGKTGGRRGWRHGGGSGNIYLNKSWTWTAFLCFISDFWMYYKCERFQPAWGLKLNGEWWIWMGQMGRLPVQDPHSISPFRPFSLWPHTDWNISHLYLLKSAQITRKVSQVELIMLTRLYCLVDAKIYKRNEQTASFFLKNTQFYCIKVNFGVYFKIQRCTRVTFKTKQFLEQTQAADLNGTPLPPADKTWNGPKVKEKLVSDNSHAQLIRKIFRAFAVRIKRALL